MVTLDVNSLYSSIRHEEAHMVTESVLDSGELLPPSTFFFMELTDIILEGKNRFQIFQSILLSDYLFKHLYATFPPKGNQQQY